MKLAQMRYFSTACHLSSITQAAETLHISQPAITAAIKALEEELGVPLLHRGRRSVTPTPDGEVFLARCDAILTDVDGLLLDFQELGQQHNTITVGIPPMIGYFLFPQIFEDFTRRHPTVRIRLTEAGSETAMGMVKSGELELAIVALGDVPPSLEATPLIRTRMMYCVARDHPLAGRDSVSLEETVADPLILFSGGYYHQTLLQGCFAREGLQPSVLFHSNQILTIKGFVRRGLANSFLLPQVIEPGDGVTAIPIREPVEMSIAVVWRRGTFITRETAGFIRFIRSQFHSAEAASENFTGL